MVYLKSWLLYTLISAMMGTGALVCKKRILRHEHALEYLSAFKLMEVITLIFLVPFFSLTLIALPWATLIFIYFISLLMTGALLLLNKSYRHLDLSIVAPFTNLSPAIVFALAYFLLGERVLPHQAAGIGFLVLGTYVLEAHSFKEMKDIRHVLSNIAKSKYLLLALAGLTLAAMTTISEKFLVAAVSPFALLFYFYIFTFINSTLVLGMRRAGIKHMRKGLRSHGGLIFVNACFATASNLLYLLALGLAPVSIIAGVRKLSTLFAVLVSGNLFNERQIPRKTIACMIMLAGVFLVIR